MACSIDVAFRADAGPQIGTGHVMRCLALADACRAAGAATRFAGNIEDHVLRGRILSHGHGMVECGSPSDTAWIDATPAPHWVVLDGYAFGTDLQARVKASGARLLVIDDMANLGFYDVDAILNQNVHADPAAYACRAGTRMLMGPVYALLRTEFAARRPATRRDAGSRWLVTLGGADSDGVGLKVLRALTHPGLPRFDIRMLAGSSNLHFERLSEAAAAAVAAGLQVDLRRFSQDMAGDMLWADMALTAAGSTSLELACMGLPAVMIVLADNQAAVAAAVHAAGAAESLGWHASLEPDAIARAMAALARDAARRGRMRSAGQSLVDGGGARRVAEFLLEH